MEHLKSENVDPLKKTPTSSLKIHSYPLKITSLSKFYLIFKQGENTLNIQGILLEITPSYLVHQKRNFSIFARRRITDARLFVVVFFSGVIVSK